MKPILTVLFLALPILPANAGTLSIDVTGVLGPILQGVDPIHLAGDTFTATGAIDPNAAPISVSGDSGVFDLFGTLQIKLGNTTLTGYNPMLSITAPPSGPDTVFLEFSVVEYSFTPDVIAEFALPPGTLNAAALQSFWSNVTEPGGSLSYSVLGGSQDLTGTLGIDGSVSVGGVPQSSAPEPGTAILFLAAIVPAIAVKTTRRRPS